VPVRPSVINWSGRSIAAPSRLELSTIICYDAARADRHRGHGLAAPPGRWRWGGRSDGCVVWAAYLASEPSRRRRFEESILDLLIHRHPSEQFGVVRLAIEGDVFSATCNWPLDLSTDEWFTFSLLASGDEWRNALSELRKDCKTTLTKRSCVVELFLKSQGTISLNLQITGALGRSLWFSGVGPLLMS